MNVHVAYIMWVECQNTNIIEKESDTLKLNGDKCLSNLSKSFNPCWLKIFKDNNKININHFYEEF